MKILSCATEFNEKFSSLVNSLSKTSIDNYYTPVDINDEIVEKIGPDILILYKSQAKLTKYYGLTINITDEYLSSLGDFVDIHLFNNPVYKEKYSCDVVYIGDYRQLTPKFQEFASLNNVRVFNGPQDNVFCFGSVERTDIKDIYKSAKVSLYQNTTQLYEIICSDGNPCTENQLYEFGHKYEFNVEITKEEILSKYTNVIKMRELLIKFGLKQVSKKLK